MAMALRFGRRRGAYVDVQEKIREHGSPLSDQDRDHFERLDLIFRSLCAALYNYAPMSGHPGGSISSGRMVASALFDSMAYDVTDPDRADADVISYAAGHKALGLYAMWALRTEILRIGAPDLLPRDIRLRLRLEDLLGFRRNPVTDTPLFRDFEVKALDGHPTPAMPFVRLATGASGVGMASSLGLALGARDTYGPGAPRIHIVEGEGGLTPGRVAEALAAAGTIRLDNAIVHLDWNQASIDSNHVCRDGEAPGDYVQWDPAELFWLHDWNVIRVPDGKDFQQVVAAQRRALAFDTGQPTAIVYSTVKGWQYGIEGRLSHGAGHKLCSPQFYDAMAPFLWKFGKALQGCADPAAPPCMRDGGGAILERCLWNSLAVVRSVLEHEEEMVAAFARRLRESRKRLDALQRRPRDGAPDAETVYSLAGRPRAAETVPEGLVLAPGTKTTLRGELGRVLNHYNRASGGAMLSAAADLLGSTSVEGVAAGFPGGFLELRANPESRLITTGGICEDAMSGILCGLSTYGRHIGVGSSYGAFIAALGHISARLHAIGAQARFATFGDPYPTVVLIAAHDGLKTGEDGPTHADPQPLQLVQENFPPGTAIALTPWDPAEIWTLVTAALDRRPAVLIPFVTRPTETVLDRDALGLAPATAARTGVYRLRAADGASDGTVVLQGSAVAYAFLQDALPRLLEDGIDLDVYYVASAELFDALSAAEREWIYPAASAAVAVGITDFTLPTLYRWVTSERGRQASLHPFRKAHFLGSGPGEKVLLEAGLDGESQYRMLKEFIAQKVLA
jgi:transketolase